MVILEPLIFHLGECQYFESWTVFVQSDGLCSAWRYCALYKYNDPIYKYNTKKYNTPEQTLYRVENQLGRTIGMVEQPIYVHSYKTENHLHIQMYYK